MDKIVFSIIGCGAIAQRHALHIHNFGHLDSVFDIDTKKAIEFAQHHNCLYYASYEQLLQKTVATVIVVCTPNYLHSQQTILALQQGFHVICEKPMALTVTDCSHMMAAANVAQKKLFVIKQNRYNPPVVELKKVIDSAILGKIVNIQLNCFWNRDKTYFQSSNWKGKKELDGGILYTQFSHFIDLVIWLFGDLEIKYAISNNALLSNEIEFAENISCIAQFNNGAIGNFNFTINSFQKNMEGSITVFAENGTIKIGGEYLNVVEYQQIKDYALPQIAIKNKENNYGTYTGSMSNHDKVYTNVVDVLQNQAAIDVDMQDGLKTVACIEQILKVLKN